MNLPERKVRRWYVPSDFTRATYVSYKGDVDSGYTIDPMPSYEDMCSYAFRGTRLVDEEIVTKEKLDLSNSSTKYTDEFFRKLDSFLARLKKSSVKSFYMDDDEVLVAVLLLKPTEDDTKSRYAALVDQYNQLKAEMEKVNEENKSLLDKFDSEMQSFTSHYLFKDTWTPEDTIEIARFVHYHSPDNSGSRDYRKYWPILSEEFNKRSMKK